VLIAASATSPFIVGSGVSPIIGLLAPAWQLRSRWRPRIDEQIKKEAGAALKAIGSRYRTRSD
jgi:hypothetical protein